MLKITSRSRVVIGIIFGINGIIYIATGQRMLAGVWLFCSAVHLIDAYRLYCREQEEN